MNKLIFFSAPWCQPCQKFGPIMDKLAQTGVPIQKIDVDQDRGTALEYRVRTIPTVIKIDHKGNIMNRFAGARPLEEVKKFYNS